MKINKVTKQHKQYPKYFHHIAHPPKQFYYLGAAVKDFLPAVTIVGARRLTLYGKQVTYQLAHSLAKQGITIVSGLALGIDGIAHQAALDAGGRTIAVLACGLDQIYPVAHHALAQKIIDQQGTIISEYEVGTAALKQNFIARNRLVAALGDMTVITEAAEASGSLTTASFALEQNKLLGAVPGNITSSQSVGCNNLIKTGAIPITSVQEVLDALGLRAKKVRRLEIFGDTKEEQIVIDLMKQGTTELGVLQAGSGLSPAVFNQTITMLELAGKIYSLGAAHWTLK